MRPSIRLLLLLLLVSTLVSVAPCIAIAQDLDNVTITGRVTDQNGAVISGATVTATLIKTKVERTAVTDSDGRYKLIQLEPGGYYLKVFANSFQPHVLPN